MALPTILLILAALSMGATVIAVLIAFRSQKEASSAIFPIVREEEANRAQRARISIFVWLAVTALFLGGWLATLRLVQPASPQEVAAMPTALDQASQPAQPAIEETPLLANQPTQPTATDTPVSPEPSPTQPAKTSAVTVTNTPAPTATPAPTQTPTPQPSATPTATDTAAPPTNTPTQTVTPEPPTATPTVFLDPDQLPSGTRTPAPPDVRVGPITFASEITDDMEPVNPGVLFSDGVEKIYAVFPFSGMSKGLEFKAIWYQNGVEVAREEGQWPWGQRARSFAFFVPRGEGLYKLELYIYDTVVATKIFEIR